MMFHLRCHGHMPSYPLSDAKEVIRSQPQYAQWEVQTGLRFREDVAKMDMDTKAIVERIQDISELSYNYYKPLVDSIIVEKASKKEVEHLLDYMLDVCHDDRMLNLFKKVCRRYYSLYPEMIASEILAYKEWYEE